MYQFQFAQQSNRASWEFTGQLTDENDVPIDITGMSMVFGVYDKDGTQRLVASTDNGKLVVLSDGMFNWQFTLTEMRSLCRGTYATGLTLSPDADHTTQIGTGTLPIIDGNVP